MPTTIIVLGAVIWNMAIASFFVSPQSLPAQVGRLLFWIMVIGHPIEFVAFHQMLKRAPGSLIEHFWKTFFVGFIHLVRVWQGTKTSNAPT